ncbi:MarR family winged helix-turn-helix transcriptional regulator [Subtercola endophyticus]|uniref:MarR family winged helix-turn-helix transcriptional regulator n=1 Tax=Subtercola endophyticus TaxID=2895559 RepID=UPI001E5CFBC5|nr:MarR family winged helix-turn-helix transcriptional regulator [Subtercola endophyticus]UFS57450.1 MarR family winged helix-turn-helix transcriptional regulator [Subtercola endophyticus]
MNAEKTGAETTGAEKTGAETTGAETTGAEKTGAETTAAEFERLFRAVYLGLHRRDEKRSALSGPSRAILTHLAFTGPLTIGETAQHLERAQSVVSDMVSQLERKGLLERRADPADRRRSLVWLTPAGVDRLRSDESVLSETRLTDALQHLTEENRVRLFDSLRSLVAVVERSAAVPLLPPPVAAAASTPGQDHPRPTTPRPTTPRPTAPHPTAPHPTPHERTAP